MASLKRVSTEAISDTMEKRATPDIALTEKQEFVIKNIMRRIDKDGKVVDPAYIFLTGSAGTGKSTIVHELIRRYTKKYHGHGMLVVAKTGIAALNIGGKTINSQFGMDFYGKIKNQYQRTLIGSKLLIIDEISMLNKTEFEALESCLRISMQSSKPFGGLIVLCIGDFGQLHPISEKKTTQELLVVYSNLWKHFKCHKLDEVKRQSDIEFIGELEKLRQFDCSSLEYWHQFRRNDEENYDHMLHLAATVSLVESINQTRLEELLNSGAKQWNLTCTITTVNRNQIPKNTIIYPKTITNSLVHNFTLAIGTKLVCTINSPEYCNGTLCTVRDFDEDRNTIKTVLGDGTLLNIRKRVIYCYGDNREINKVYGFSINYAWALTIHKVQGITIKEAFIHTPTIFTTGQLYVALSRVSSKDGLVLSKRIRPHMIYPNDDLVYIEKWQNENTLE